MCVLHKLFVDISHILHTLAIYYSLSYQFVYNSNTPLKIIQAHLSPNISFPYNEHKILQVCLKQMGVYNHVQNIFIFPKYQYSCLLYTSDAADDMQCVDLGGRRIIKKKKKKKKHKPGKKKLQNINITRTHV
eukprot:TRINITY_DN11965_c0_g1_i1.p3 TRINITY_DN11965_c0_g1~~TRINITY_DN11965_c0_g1_i1.p3  ORF type:complete len:132 (+),score=10.47 TRINITY_DN11965_c0_g1_i1:628-1023(+)